MWYTHTIPVGTQGAGPAIFCDNFSNFAYFLAIDIPEGSIIFVYSDEAIEYFKQQGFKNLFLWTDSDCNVGWYVSHGYELADEGTYAPFSTETEEYKTFIFKKKLKNC